MTDPALTFEKKPPAAYITLDDGGMNVLTAPIVKGLRDFLQTCVTDTDISVVVLQGNAHALTVGLDTETVLKQDATANALLSDMGAVLELLYLSRLRSIVIAEGHATAAGAMLLLVADRRLGIDSKGKVGLSEVRVGLPVPELTQQLVRDRIDTPAQYATTALASLRTYPDAFAAGFFDSLHPDRTDAQGSAARSVDAFAALDEDAYLKTKLGMRQGFQDVLKNRRN